MALGIAARGTETTRSVWRYLLESLAVPPLEEIMRCFAVFAVPRGVRSGCAARWGALDAVARRALQPRRPRRHADERSARTARGRCGRPLGSVGLDGCHRGGAVG